MPLLIPALHQQQVFVREGGHKWTVWTPATREILRAIDAKGAHSGNARDAVEGSGGDRHHAEDRGNASSGTASATRVRTRSP
jgi:hypothetical protein